MKTSKTYFGEYFKKSVMHLCKSKIVFLLVTVMELMEILICLLDYQDFFFLLNQNYYATQTQLAKILLSIIPFSYYFNFFKNKDDSCFNVVYIALLIYVFLIICFFVYLILNSKESNKKIRLNINLINIIDKVCINFFDLFLFRLASIYGINTIVRSIFKLFQKNNYNIEQIIIQFLLILFLIFIVFLHYYYFSIVCIWNNFKIIDTCFSKYSYEVFYSKKYDIIMFTLKLLIVLTKNYVDCHNSIANYIVIFLTFLLEIIFFGFVFYTINLLFFSRNVLYIYLNFYNKVRIFLLIFMVEALILRFGLHTNGDYIPYLAFMITFLIFNFYIILSVLDSYILTTAINSQNYIGVCWFIQGNNVNLQNFTIEWISNHRDKCYLDIEQCPICSKLIFDFGIYKEESMQLLEKDNNINNNKSIKNDNFGNKNNKKSIVKKRTIINKTVIDEMFPPSRFFLDLIKLAEKSKKFMSKDDLIRLDILYITALFYNEKNIDYYFYTKLCLLIIKYKENSQVLITLIFVFELMYKENVSTNQKYEILKKNEELRKSLEKYLKEYNEFLVYSDKSPINYSNISKKYKEFKDILITIHKYFRKNMECSYELLLMRYIYELLVYQKFKNIQPFDLNNYIDFIEYNYANNKSFIIKNIIDQDVFIILKGSKDIIKYQNQHFENLFPSEFQNDAINKFKKKLNELDKNEINPLFEYPINSFVNSTSQLGFVNSFKMRYIIYPTNLINELYIQVNYVVGYNNIIILEKNTYGIDILFSYSPKLYKIFGIYPSDIYLLKKAGINIRFDKIFTKFHNNKNSQEQDEKHIYTFKYEIYSSLLKHLLTYDVLKDSSNYNQIIDKKNEFETFRLEKKEIQFQFTKKWEYKNENNNTYKFFSIKEIRKKKPNVTISKYNSHKSKSFLGLNEDNEENSNSDEEEYLEENLFEGRGMTMAGSTLSSTSISRSFKSEESGKQKGKKDEKLDEKRKKKEQLNRYTYILLCFSIILIIITLIFLILEINENNHFRKVINLFITFRVFKRGIERYPLTLLSNFQIYYKKNTSINIYEQYSKKLGEKSDILKNYNLNDVLIQDLISKLDVVIDRFNKYQIQIHNLGSTLAKKINALRGFRYEIYFENNNIWCHATNVSLITLFRSYLNIISTLLKDNDFYDEKFPLVNFNDTDATNTIVETVISYNSEITMILKNMFLLSFSYPYSHSGLVNTANIIIEESREIINLITIILIIFFTILIILHIVLGLIAILFIILFTNVLKLNILDSNKLFEDKKFLEFHQRRLEQINIMKNLYSENPIKIADKIEAIKEFYKRKKSEEVKDTSNKNFTNDFNTNSLSDKKQKDNESIKDDKSEISKTNKQKQEQQNISNLNSIKESLILDNENKNNNTKNKNIDIKDTEFNEIKFENVITSKNIKLTQKQFSSILKIQYILIFISFGFYFIYSIILFSLVFTLGIKELKHLVDYSNYNDLIDGYLYDNANALLFMMQTNSTSIYYGNIDNPGKNTDYIEEGINLLYKAIIGKEDIEQNKGSVFEPIDNLLNLNCSNELIKYSDFMSIAEKLGFDYDKYFGELCKIFPVAQSGSDKTMFYEVLYLVDKIYRKFSTKKKFESLFDEYLNQTMLYDLFTLVLTFCRIQRNHFDNNYFPNEVNEVLNNFALLIYIYLVAGVVLEIIIFLIVYFGIIVEVKKKDNLIVNFTESLKYD